MGGRFSHRGQPLVGQSCPSAHPQGAGIHGPLVVASLPVEPVAVGMAVVGIAAAAGGVAAVFPQPGHQDPRMVEGRLVPRGDARFGHEFSERSWMTRKGRKRRSWRSCSALVVGPAQDISRSLGLVLPRPGLRRAQAWGCRRLVGWVVGRGGFDVLRWGGRRRSPAGWVRSGLVVCHG